MSYIVPLAQLGSFSIFEHTNGPDDAEHVQSTKAVVGAHDSKDAKANWFHNNKSQHENSNTAPVARKQPEDQLSKKEKRAAKKAAHTADGKQHSGAKNTTQQSHSAQKQGTPPAKVSKAQKAQTASADGDPVLKQGKAKRMTKQQRRQAKAAAAGGGQQANDKNQKGGTTKQNKSKANTTDDDDDGDTDANSATKPKGLLAKTRNAAAATYKSAKGGATALRNAQYKSSVIAFTDLPNQQVYYTVKGQNNVITYFGHITGRCEQARKNKTVDVRFTEFRREQKGKLFGTSNSKKMPLVHPDLIAMKKKLTDLHLVGGDPNVCISTTA